MKIANRHPSYCLKIGLLLALGLGACQAPPVQTPTPSLGTPLEFETISLDNHGVGTSNIVKPEVFFIDNQEDAEQIEDQISAESFQELANLDFKQDFALAAFRGRKPTSGYEIVIERIEMQDGRLVVYAQFWEPSPWSQQADIATSPYHIVDIRRQADIDHTLELILHERGITPTPPPNLPP